MLCKRGVHGCSEPLSAIPKNGYGKIIKAQLCVQPDKRGCPEKVMVEVWNTCAGKLPPSRYFPNAFIYYTIIAQLVRAFA